MKHDSRQFDNDGFAVMGKPATVSPHLVGLPHITRSTGARYASRAIQALPKREANDMFAICFNAGIKASPSQIATCATRLQRFGALIEAGESSGHERRSAIA
jgi:hypothetical protein